MGVVWEQGAGKGRENAPILSFEVGCCPIVHLPDLGEHTPHLGEREGGREREREISKIGLQCKNTKRVTILFGSLVSSLRQ